MHKLIDYICDELEELERKADKEGQLSMQELEYGDMLAHFKKSLLTADAMMEYDESMEGGSYARGRGRNARRDSMGRYSSREYSSRESYRGSGRSSYENSSRERGGSRRSRGYSQDAEEVIEQLRELEMNAQDEETRRMIQKFIKQAEENA